MDSTEIKASNGSCADHVMQMLTPTAGSGIAPFFPISSPSSNPLLLPYHAFLFFLRLPFLIFAWSVWLVLVRWTPAGGPLRKLNLWCILGIPGVWWLDIRVDGAQRGSLGRSGRLPDAGDVIAASYTSPLDVLYLACIFDPVFTQSYPGSRHVRPLSLEAAIAACFHLPPQPDKTIELSQLIAQNPKRVIVVFPESTTSNGRGVLRLSPSLLSTAKQTAVFPISMRYTPSDVVTPIPGILEAVRFCWKLFSRQTHTIRVRVGLPMNMTQQKRNAADEIAREARGDQQPNGYDTNFFDSLQNSAADIGVDTLAEAELRSLDTVAEALSRLGRAKTLGLGVEEKTKFVDAWLGKSKTSRKRR